ncbi:hypothetical protein [Spiroplasma endosymbiont of Lonchoptera lutea]|uniref:hypothetical protein n=1 Tax=Spiroplasma endosymbiont of Lonchoptera lutea TaxID=3066297 RepID=UPI0030D13BC2
MANLEKMASFFADIIYKVFDLIWSMTIPGTGIRIIIIPLISLIVNFVFVAILGIGMQAKESYRKARTNKSVKEWGKK